jgi:hypothetical protein
LKLGGWLNPKQTQLKNHKYIKTNNMKTTEQINQIKTLKGIIAEYVNNHKETKRIARMSSNAEGYNVWKTGSAQTQYAGETDTLFILYTVYYILRHDVEDIDAYAEKLSESLKPWKREKNYCFETFGFKNSVLGIPTYQCAGRNLADTLKITINFLAKYVETNEGSKE